MPVFDELVVGVLNELLSVTGLLDSMTVGLIISGLMTVGLVAGMVDDSSANV